jgi:partner of Y14 and mago protein
MPPGFREDLPERVIAASTRADGSVRKPIRVRAGYVNQDEVPKYRPGAFRRQKQEAEARGEPLPQSSPERRLVGANGANGEAGGRGGRGANPASREDASREGSKPPSESASASKPAAAEGKGDAAATDARNVARGVDVEDESLRESSVREPSEKTETTAAAATPPESPLDEWSALDEELEKALALSDGSKKKRHTGKGRR